MDKPSVDIDQRLRGQLRLNSITLDTSVFLTIIGVLISAVAEQLAQPYGLLVHKITLDIFLLMTLSCLLMVIWQSYKATKELRSTYFPTSITAGLGSFLFSLLSVLLSGTNQLFTPAVIIGTFISICAILVGFLLSLNQGMQNVPVDQIDAFVQNQMDEGEIEPGNPHNIRTQFVPSPYTSQPTYEPNSRAISSPPTSTGSPHAIQRSTDTGRRSKFEKFRNSQPPQLEIQRSISAESLPPLFVDDPLYIYPERAKTSQFFVVAKSNDLLAYCDDSYAVSKDEALFALCDGTGSSHLPRPWATLLAQQWIKKPFLEKPDANTFYLWLEEPREQWEEWVLETWLPTLNDRNSKVGFSILSENDAKKITREGASSTFLGIQFDKKRNQWWARAIGDTCLFICRPILNAFHSQDYSIVSFPLNSSTQFNDMPPSITSRLTNTSSLLRYLVQAQDRYQSGDIFIMATDALSAWILMQKEQGTRNWLKLLRITNNEQFEKFVTKERDYGQLTDDDTTLIIIRP